MSKELNSLLELFDQSPGVKKLDPDYRNELREDIERGSLEVVLAIARILTEEKDEIIKGMKVVQEIEESGVFQISEAKQREQDQNTLKELLEE